MAFLRGPQDFVNDMLYSNCQRPFYIYVTTFIPAFLEAWFMVRFFDLDDIVRDRARSITGRGGPRGPGKHISRKSGKAIPRKAGKNYGYSLGLKHLLVLTQPLENIGFALLMYGAVDNFYANWMMYLDDADACLSPQFFGPLIRNAENSQCFPNAGGNAIQLPTLVSDPANWGSNNFTATLPLGQYRMIFAAKIIGPSGGADYHLELRVTNVLGTGIFRGPTVTLTGDGPQDLIVTADPFIFSVLGGQVSWVIVGPPVPVGLAVEFADIYIQRQSQAL